MIRSPKPTSEAEIPDERTSRVFMGKYGTVADRAYTAGVRCRGCPEVGEAPDGWCKLLLPNDDILGSEIGPYRLSAVLGRGGMGIVYLAEDVRLRRRVAVKVVAPEIAGDSGFRDRFLREARLAASLDHPNIIPVYEAGEADGVLFLAMRYVEGRDLREALVRDGAVGSGADRRSDRASRKRTRRGA